MTTTPTAQLEAQTEHFTVAQAAMYALLTTNTQRAAFIEACPAPVEATGNLHMVIELDGVKEAGFPTYVLARKNVGAAHLADLIDATSTAIKDGVLNTETGEPITRHDLQSRLTIRLVHSNERTDVVVGGNTLDTEAASDARAERDAAYRAKTGGANGAINPSAQPTVNLAG